MTLTKLVRAMGCTPAVATVHGFRSSFRDWAGDQTDYHRDVAEMALAHSVRDGTEAAYRRLTALEKRRGLMTAWAEHCMSAPARSVVPIRGAA
jgi:hypothetical protein